MPVKLGGKLPPENAEARIEIVPLIDSMLSPGPWIVKVPVGSSISSCVPFSVIVPVMFGAKVMV